MATIDEELGALERDIRQLKIEYDQFFGGGRKRPPNEIEWRIELVVKKYGERSGDMKYGQRFRYNNLTQTYAKYKDIFRKRMKQKEEGTVSVTSVPRQKPSKRNARRNWRKRMRAMPPPSRSRLCFAWSARNRSAKPKRWISCFTPLWTRRNKRAKISHGLLIRDFWNSSARKPKNCSGKKAAVKSSTW